nr:hypothetical protein 2 [Rhodospirillaceae bacterium]
MAGVGVGTIAMTAASVLASENARRSTIKSRQRSYQNQMNLLNARNQQAEKNRKEELKRLSARQRARFSAQGVGTADGSSSAVLEGMKSLSEEQAQQRDRLAELRRSGDGAGSSSLSGSNLLVRNSPMLLDNMARLMNWD